MVYKYELRKQKAKDIKENIMDISEEIIEVIWNNFKEEIKYKNRFFFNKSIEYLFSNIFAPNAVRMFDSYKCKAYRVRKGNYVDSDDREMLEAPSGKPGLGRCNPIGISYLYAAHDISTALREVIKVSDSEEVHDFTVAELELDLGMVFSFAYYRFDYMYESRVDKKSRYFFEMMNKEFGKMITMDNQIDYLPLQYVSEYIKNLGFDGFVFVSSVTGSLNYVMFNEHKRRILRKGLLKVQGNNVAARYEIEDVVWNDEVSHAVFIDALSDGEPKSTFSSKQSSSKESPKGHLCGK